jgi:hypothetical protein
MWLYAGMMKKFLLLIMALFPQPLALPFSWSSWSWLILHACESTFNQFIHSVLTSTPCWSLSFIIIKICNKA